jgi:hypothetical protein
MDGREGGFIKLHRQLESWPLWRAMPVGQRMVWIQILLSANWKDDSMWCGNQRITVKRGQLAHAEMEIANRAGVGRQVVRDALNKLQREGAITRQKILQGNHSPWLVTIVNYDRFQGQDEEENPRPRLPGTTEEPTGNQEGTTEEPQEKKGRREEEKDTAAPSAPAVKKPAKTDPRFAPLRAVWLEEFKEATGKPYHWGGPMDAAGIHRVIAVPIDEFREKARAGLRAAGWLRSATVAKLTSNEVWNQLAAAPAANVTTIRRAVGSVGDFTKKEANEF